MTKDNKMEFEDLDRDFNNLKNIHNSTNEAVMALERENLRLRNLNELLSSERKQWEQDKIFQQQIIQQALTSSNFTNNSYLEENQRLKEEIKLLKEEISRMKSGN